MTGHYTNSCWAYTNREWIACVLQFEQHDFEATSARFFSWEVEEWFRCANNKYCAKEQLPWTHDYLETSYWVGYEEWEIKKILVLTRHAGRVFKPKTSSIVVDHLKKLGASMLDIMSGIKPCHRRCLSTKWDLVQTCLIPLKLDIIRMIWRHSWSGIKTMMREWF